MNSGVHVPPARRVRALGLDLHVVDVDGDAGSPPVVLVHGWPTSSFLWRKVIERLSGTGRLVAPDLPGFGRSEKPAAFSYGLEAQAGVLGSLVDALGLERGVLAAHDLGGPVGLLWAVRNPGRVVGLVVLNTLFHRDGPARLFLSGSPVGPLGVLRARAGARLRLLLLAARTPGLRRLVFGRALVAEAMRMGTRDRSALSREDLSVYAGSFAGAAGRTALRRTFLGPRWEEIAAVEEGIGALACPAEVVVGTADVLLPGVEEDMRRLAAALPRADLRLVPGCGHFVPEDRPDAVAEAIRRVARAAG
ncbi:MAG TPA: alpha/beta fold hydrolase [Anaeromyxobacteraceae bacterium]|nr:alpha/beta fold hydrolase [Anaeromyxobacteraceae bacterium]